MPPIALNTLVASLRPEQGDAVNAALAHLRDALVDNHRGGRGSLLLVSPTGTGKSYIQGAIHRCMREQYGIEFVSTFPQSEIAEAVFLKTYGPITGFIASGQSLLPGFSPPAPSAAAKQRVLEAHGFWTIKRLHNALLAGTVKMPQAMQHDEAHHSVDDTHEVVHAVCGLCPRVGATATDYRGTAEETSKLRERWPRHYRVLTLKSAVEKGRLSMPSWDVWPLLNDETIDVKGGEFSVSSVESHLGDVLDDLCDRIRPFWGTRVYKMHDGRENQKTCYDRPTMIAVSGVGAVEMVVERLRQFGLPATGVTGKTSDADRVAAFHSVTNRDTILVQIRVVGEGVDLPMRRLIDLAPTVSPVLWMQRVGRITRPVGEGEAAPEYIACCHNLSRHAYLWYGLMPASAIKKASQAWGKDFKPSRRFLARAIDVQGLGRFQPGAIPFRDAGTGTVYAMQTKDGLQQYAIILHPLRPDPWFFGRSIPLTGETKTDIINGVEVTYNEKDYDADSAKWREIPSLPELKGMVSIPPGKLTDSQLRWWKRSAKGFGLDAEVEITNREFQVLPILANSGVKLRV